MYTKFPIMSIKTHDVTGVYDVLVMYPDELRYRKLIRHPFQCFADEVIVTSGKDVTVVTVGHAVDDLTKIDAVRAIDDRCSS